jgi:hypothetical protein
MSYLIAKILIYISFSKNYGVPVKVMKNKKKYEAKV